MLNQSMVWPLDDPNLLSDSSSLSSSSGSFFSSSSSGSSFFSCNLGHLSSSFCFRAGDPLLPTAQPAVLAPLHVVVLAGDGRLAALVGEGEGLLTDQLQHPLVSKHEQLGSTVAP